MAQPTLPAPLAEEAIPEVPGSGHRALRFGRASGLLSWLAPALVMLVVGFYGSAGPQLWGDELASWRAADRSTSQLWHMLHNIDAVYGVYYLLLHFWINVFGDSATSLRAPSAIAMAGAAAFIALTGRKLFSARAGLLAGLVFVTIPMVSRFAQEARPYAIVMCAVAAATFLLFRALERPSLLRWICYGLSVTVVGLFQLVALSVLVPHFCLVALQYWPGRGRPWRRLAEFTGTAVLAVVPALPLALEGQTQVTKQISWISRPTLDSLPALWDGLFGTALVSLPLLILAAMPLGWNRNRRPVFQLLLIGSLPVVLIYLVSTEGNVSYFLTRYMLFILSAWAVLAGAGLAAVRPKLVAVLAFAVLVPFCWKNQQSIRTAYDRVPYDERAAAQMIAKGYQPGDGLVIPHDPTIWDAGVEVYLPQRVVDGARDVFLHKTAAQLNGLAAEECPQPAACVGDEKRLWVVTQGPDQPAGTQRDPLAALVTNTAGGLTPAEVTALSAKYTATSVTHLKGIWVTLLEHR